MSFSATISKITAFLGRVFTVTHLKIVAIIAGIAIAIFATIAIKNHYQSAAENLYKQELSGQLSQSQKETQTANTQLSTLNAKLATQQQLNDAIKKDRDATSAAFDKWKKDHGMIPISDTNAIVDVKDDCGDRRFKIVAEVDREKNGFLEAQKLTLTEVDAQGNPIKNATSSVISSSFVYVDAPTANKDKILTLRWVADINYSLFNTLGFGGGMEFLSFHNFGLGAAMNFDSSTIKDTQAGLFLDYNFRLLNLAPFIGFNTFLADPFQKNSLSVGVLFYITD